jgi:hypothetical protein
MKDIAPSYSLSSALEGLMPVTDKREGTESVLFADDPRLDLSRSWLIRIRQRQRTQDVGPTGVGRSMGCSRLQATRRLCPDWQAHYPTSSARLMLRQRHQSTKRTLNPFHA